MTLYHVSEQYLGMKPLLVPRVPLSAREHESDVPRICAAPTVGKCYLACEVLDPLLMRCKAPGFYVYAADTEQYRSAPALVKDARLTQEKWIETPTRFTRLVKMPPFGILDVFPRGRPTSCAYAERAFQKWINEEFTYQLRRKARASAERAALSTSRAGL